MWSGPRNISTAMMRAWGNRADTVVCDEPLYAHYLKTTGRDHPGGAETIEAGETDPTKVVQFLLGPVPGGKPVFYQKHMTHHLLPAMDRGWMRGLSNAFLIRDPREMLTSFIKHVPDPTLLDTGYPQQVEIFELVRNWTGAIPPVLDSKHVLDHPRKMLELLCEALGVEFSERMLSWEPGLRDTDGIWAKYWYKEVVHTTSFQPYRPKAEKLPTELHDLLDQCLECYERLYAHRLCA
ncbi:MAG TPA: hypothetical protein VLJ39_13310 [Tepidisphaeraceae bacterium]|nr:hypothetical protein [Tepidisphaeraceae bacterium]